MTATVLAHSLRTLREGVCEEVIFYGVEGGLAIYGGGQHRSLPAHRSRRLLPVDTARA
jgi:hypothetical protein